MSGQITSSTLYSVNMTSLAGGTAGGAEVAAYDATRKLAVVLGANGVDFLNVATGARVGGIGKADVGGTGGTPTSLLGTANSVAIHGDKMAVSYDGASAGVNGYVAMFQLNATGSAATWLYTVTGPSAATFAVPDMVTFTPDGSKLLVALEGEPASNYSVDPFGGVGVINVATGTLQIADFTAFDSQKAALIAAGVRLNAPSDGATPVAGAGLVSKDVEPEYITISSDGSKAYVTLQEANSLAVVDLTGTPTVTAILPFGTKDHSLAGNGMDTSDQDGLSGANANIRTVPVKGLYMPDAIASFEQGGKTYLVTANEGDAREYSANTDVVRLNSKTAGAYNIQLDPTVFGANINNTALEATTIRAAADLGRLNVSRTNGDTDNDGDIDVIHSIGARSFSIWTIEGGALTRTYDSGDLIEQTLKANFPTVLDDTRSDDKGPEPEHVTLGRMNGDLYAFVGLERATAGNSTIMSFRIDGPSSATYTGTIISTGTGAQAPEAFTFVPGTLSAAGTGDPMLLVPNETAGVFRAVSLSETPAYTLQILSYYGESGLLGTKTAAKMGALIDKFDDQYANTLVLAEGDSYIPGPWLIGGADPSLNAVPGIGSTALGRPDIAIMNAFGTDASALGNHEFDLGSPVFQSAITASGSWVGAQFPFITANINTAADSSLRGISDKTLGGTSTNNFAGQETTAIKGKIAPYAISTQGGEKIGIIGITTFDLLIKSSPNGTVPKDDGNPATTDIQEVAIYVQAAVDALKLMGVNKIVMVDQLDTIERNKELAPLISGVDIMVAGGGHERLGDANDVAVGFNGHTADFLDTFPILLSGADGKPTLLVTTDTEYTYLGRLVVDFDAAGDIIVNNLNPTINGAYASTEASLQAAYGTTQTADQIVAGSTIGAKVDAITDAIQSVIAAKDGTVWGYTNVYLEGDRAFGRAQEVNFGNISADANMFKAQAALGAGAFVTSLKNGGGLRASVGSIDEDGSKIPPVANPEVGKPAGAISTLDIENALRFDNKLMVFDTTAAGLKNILEYAAGLPAGNGGYMQIGGIRVSFDPDNAVGSKVVNISLTDASGRIIARVVENGAVVADAPAVISMVSLNFTANGGDGYPIKANATNFRYLLTDGTLSAAIDPALDFTAAINLPATALGEQKAFQDFLTAFHATPATAYSQADTPASQDVRIENLNARTTDIVFQGESMIGTPGAETLNGFAGNDTINGSGGNDVLNGAAGNDSLVGEAGNDRLDGGAGADVMAGGLGNDTYFVSQAGDVVVENPNEGTDAVRTTLASMNLGANLEYLVFVGTGNFTGTGNDLANEVHGGAGDDTLSGGGGNDLLYGYGGSNRLIGGTGNDIYVVTSATDVIVENANEGSDSVRTTLASYTLGSHLEGLAFNGTGNFSGTGNELNNAITGGAGNDTLVGGAGNDQLTGLGGTNRLEGGTGDDTYVVTSATDVIVENANEGTDLVSTSLNSYTLGANLERLAFTGTGNFTGVGNELNNRLTGGTGNDTLSGGGGNDVLYGGAGSDVAIFEGTRAAATITRTAPGNWTVTTATGGTDTLIGVEEIRFSDSSLFTTSETPYLVSSTPSVSFASILSAGDVAGTKGDGTPWRMVGIPDGMGAYDNGDGTMTVLMNQEIGNTSGVIRAHGSIGSFISKIVIDKATLGVVSGSDLATTVYQDNDGDGVYTVGTTAWSRFCSGDLADVSAFYDAASGLGSTARIYLSGEESGPEGRAFAFVATGAEAGRAYELPTMGNMSFENVLARPNSGAKTVAVMTDDATPGQVYFYIGDKQATGNEVEKAGLTNGKLYGIAAAGIGNNASSEAALNGAVPLSGSFTLQEIVDARTKTGAQIETASDTAGVTEWWRPEDGAWDVINPNRFYFVTTASVTGPSRLWALDFVDATNPALGGTFTALLDGTEGQKMFDNITVGTDGTLVLVEDVGNNARLGKVWHYDPSTDVLTEAGQHDPGRFGSAGPGFLTQDEEASGVIEVTSMLGDADTRAFLLNTQAHYGFGATGSADRTEIVEGGQLQVMYVETAQTGTGSNNTLIGSFVADTLNGLGGNDSLVGGGGNDSLDGGTGADTMAGGVGNDTYRIDNAADVIIELAGEGTDTVLTSIGAHTLGANVENVTYTGPGAFTGNGNGLANIITGAGGSDTLNGGEGSDTLFGLDNNDRLNGGAGADVLMGGAGNDVLDGGLGADVLTGGVGNDIFRFVRGEAAGDMITDFLGNGSAAGDGLVFVGYGTAAAGASFTSLGGNDWQLRSADGLVTEVISITGSVVSQDWVFS